MRIEKVPGGDCGGWCCWCPKDDCDGKVLDVGSFKRGEKVRRKVESPLRCLTVRDMAKVLLSRSP